MNLRLRKMSDDIVTRFNGMTFSDSFGNEWLRNEIDKALEEAYRMGRESK